jgi:hypothetical protein
MNTGIRKGHRPFAQFALILSVILLQLFFGLFETDMPNGIYTQDL